MPTINSQVEDFLAQKRIAVFEFMGSSVSKEAAAFCRKNNTLVIEGGCPMMYCEPVDFGHKCMRWLLKITGGLPQ